MSEFTKEWLALREPADIVSRNPNLAKNLADYMRGQKPLKFIDLGCGTGANLRSIALLAPAASTQSWTLVDHDPALLVSARECLVQWADRWSPSGSGIRIEKDGRDIEVAFCRADLNSDIGNIIKPGSIATASAFFDLSSLEWIARFVKAAAEAQAPVYAPLIYSGAEVWLPPHPADGPMLAAFHAHQHRNKGLGNAQGPDATVALSNALCAAGYSVEGGDSSWRLGEEDSRLIEELAKGTAAAVAELKVFDEPAIAAWRKSRKRAKCCVIGHTDILAFPRR